MSIGKIVAPPITGQTPFAHVTDEYGNHYSVHESEIPDDVEEGDDYAYQVDVRQGMTANSTSLRKLHTYE